MDTIKQFKQGDYVFFTEREQGVKKKEVYIVNMPNWSYNRTRTFNGITLVNIETGENYNTNDKRHLAQLQLIPEDKLKQYKDKVIKIQKKVIKAELGIIKQVSESLESIFPNNWELVTYTTSGINYKLIIKFPEIEIVNGKNMKHTINDLYIIWEFGKGFRIKSPLSGVRGVLSYIEYQSGYSHSHLPTKQFESLNRFCLGSGEFASANIEWKHPDHVFQQEEFELLLYQLEAYLKWESLQGGPYIRMENISIQGENIHMRKSDLEYSYEKVVANIKAFPLKFNMSNNKFEVHYNTLESYIVNVPDIINIKKTSGGDYIYGEVTKATIESWIKTGNKKGKKTPILKFKGEDIFYTIMELENYDDSKLQTVPHPDITNYIARELTRNTNHYFINKYGK